MNLTQLEAGKRGPALLNRLVGDASIYKKLLDRKPLTSVDGVKYFMETETSRHQMRSECFPPAMFLFISCKERKHGNSQVD